MKRRRKNKRKERILMLGSSVLVLTALTVTGLYVKEKKQDQNDGYVVDLSELEENNIPEFTNEKIEIQTKGMGHGFGFSQYEANQLAKSGESYEQLLHCFFENFSLEKI